MQREDVERRLRLLRIAVVVLPLVFMSVFPLVWPSRTHLAAAAGGALAVIVFGLLVSHQVERGFRHMLALQERAVAAERHSAVLQERERIAREMHDSLAQVLSVAHLKLRTLQDAPELEAAGRVRAELGELADLCRESCRDVRESILGLRESGRTDRGFVEGLEHYLASWSRSSGVAAWLELDVEPEAPEQPPLGQGAQPPWGQGAQLPPAHEVQLSRVVQEALTNVRKHARASNAVVRLGHGDEGTVLSVCDDGVGFDAQGAGHADHYGLHTMRERVEHLGGTFAVTSRVGEGTRVEARLPCRMEVLG